LPDIRDDGDSEDHFVALKEAPLFDMTTPGLHLTLQTSVLGSISKNSPISFKQLPIGYVTGYQYVDQNNMVDINVYIEPEYAHLIKKDSLFWNSSGVQVVASLASGLTVNVDSLASIISGGIAVDNISNNKDAIIAKNGQTYTLHNDFQSAQMGHKIELILDWDSGVTDTASIVYQGMTIGQIKSFKKIDPQQRKIIALAKVNPRVIPYLTEQSQFYVVSPRIDLSGVKNAKALVTGAYISVVPSLDGEKINNFQVFNTKPAYKYSEPGLHLVLQSSDIRSLQVGNSLYYKQQIVGNIQALETITPDQSLVHIHIKPEYQHYVTAHSHFYNVSGVKLSANLRGVELELNSLQSVLAGGIAFDIGGTKGIDNKQIQPMNGDIFHLYKNEKLAAQRNLFILTIAATEQVSAKTRILYRGEEVGAVHRIETHENVSKLSVGILPKYEYILRENSQFWLVRPQLSLSGATDTDALFGGSYITFHASDGEEKKAFALLTSPPAKPASAEGLQLTLKSDNANVASAGSAVSYRGVVVGQVDSVILDKKVDQVLVHISIDEKHRKLIKTNTRFYNAGGVTVTGGVNNFVVKTESLDAILRGGISFYNPKNKLTFADTEFDEELQEQEKFSLIKHIEQAKNAGLAINVHFNNVTGLKVNTKVVYQEQTVGSIERLIFNKKQVGVTALILLNDLGAQHALAGTKFWLIQPQIGLVGSKNVAALLDGGTIGMMPGNGEQQTAFNAEDLPPVIQRLPYGLNLKLITSRLGSVRVGDPVLYRQVKVGEVIGVDLAHTANKVNVFINITPRYAPLVNQGSKFWNTSGFRVEAGIFSGIKVDSESIETLLAGGIAFATPELNSGESIDVPSDFILYQNIDEDWLAWQPEIVINK
jgi:paraquat-inducible protein B